MATVNNVGSLCMLSPSAKEGSKTYSVRDNLTELTCDLCHIGQVLESHCTTDRNTKCRPLIRGEERMPHPNFCNSGFRCKTCPGPSETVKQLCEPGGTTDTECKCAKDYFLVNGEADTCGRCSKGFEPQPGGYVTTETSTTIKNYKPVTTPVLTPRGNEIINASGSTTRPTTNDPDVRGGKPCHPPWNFWIFLTYNIHGCVWGIVLCHFKKIQKCCCSIFQRGSYTLPEDSSGEEKVALDEMEGIEEHKV